MDALGHVNNVVYVDYLQEARVDMLSLHGQSPLGQELAEGIVVVRHEIDFLAPLVFRPEPIRIESWVTQVRAASFTLAYEILDVGADGSRYTYTKASTILSPFVFATERPRRISAEEKGMLEMWVDEGQMR